MPSPTKLQSCVVPNSEEPGFSYIIRNKDNVSPEDVRGEGPLPDNVFDMLKTSVKAKPDSPFLGTRSYDPATNKHGDYEWMDYQTAYDKILKIGSGYVNLFKKHARPDADINEITRLPIGMYSVNRREWVVADYAAVSQNIYSVSLYDTLGVDSLEYIMNHAEIEVLVCSLDKIPRILKIRERLPKLRVVISMDSLTTNPDEDASLPSPFNTKSVGVLKQWAEASDIALYDLDQVEAIGAENPVHPRTPKSDDIFCMCYTSGTTGMPKAAMIMHRNLDYVQRAVSKSTPDKHVVLLSYLPLAHIYERFIEVYAMRVNGQIGFYTGNILNIVDDIQTLRPTFFNSVPRLLNRIYERITAGTIHAPGLTGVIARKAVSDKLANLDAGKGNKHAFWDRVIFNKIRAILGGRIEFVLTGSAPIEKSILKFLRVCFCCQVSEGWGQTESTGLGMVTLPDEVEAGKIGVPQYGLELRLKDVPEMDYFATDKPCPRGEMLIRGLNVFGGYYKDEEKTRETILEGGWLATGDIAKINEDGSVSIIDRKKNIFKLSQGEYVAPENLENVYGKNSLIMQVFVHGDSLENFLVGVVVPEPEAFVPWGRRITGRTAATYEDLCRDEKVNRAFVKELLAEARKNKLQGFEVLKAVHIDHRPFDVENNDILTPTLKLKRNIAAKYYRKEIDAMYTQVKAATADK